MVHVVSFFGSLFTNVYKSNELFDDKKVATSMKSTQLSESKRHTPGDAAIALAFFALLRDPIASPGTRVASDTEMGNEALDGSC